MAYLSQQVPIRRAHGGDDLFSELCRATTEGDALMSAQAVVDHMSFLMMAAHDTLTSSLSAFVWLLAANPHWQERLRGEVASLGLTANEPLSFDQLDAMRLTEMAFKETLRIIPPVPAVPRRALRDFTFTGHRIPAGTSIAINPLFTHHMPDIWPDPDRFDPERFTEAAEAARHRYAFVPFGGGAHMCLGLHFAYMQAKCFVRASVAEPRRQRDARLRGRLEDVADTAAKGRTAYHHDACWEQPACFMTGHKPSGDFHRSLHPFYAHHPMLWQVGCTGPASRQCTAGGGHTVSARFCRLVQHRRGMVTQSLQPQDHGR